ncbi:GNAT family N-acetyltransferase [Streptomyces sp. SAJ15]|uniref:GNAT family N-acetyltransferase n=1 Tax=Streptomyces sp. SAJ15 TaxID=2011095 RepID=UPI001C929632|nr:GNAT family N-acetyltransferase [Streptomyces sp. SAJ15]
MRSDVSLHPLDQALLKDLRRVAVADAEPREVMPPVGGPDGWTLERQAAFLRFHESRALAVEPVETTFAVVVGERVVGAARLCPMEEPAGAVEAGVWIGRSHRGAGVGGAVLKHLLDRARAEGIDTVCVSTAPENTAVRRLMTRMGVDLVHEGDVLTGWIDPAAVVQP